MSVKIRKKLIEVALPLEAINIASAREKSIRHGHPSTLHLWWARRPLAAARAVIFAQMVDDPSSWPDLYPTEKAQEKERQRLFRIIEDLVLWTNTTNETVLQKARDEIWRSWRRTCAENADHPLADQLFIREKLPGFHDPFAGGGALPLEALRLGLESHASDLNPVAVLINKAMIEIPPKFANQPPVNPKAQRNCHLQSWTGTQGLANDIVYYGQWMRNAAEKQIGHLYPNIHVTDEMFVRQPELRPFLGKEIKVVAWLWARTVKSPNPAYRDLDVPLTTSFLLSTKPGQEMYIEPVIENGNYQFEVRSGKPENEAKTKRGTKLARGANFECVMSGSPITAEYIKAEGRAGRIGSRLLAVVAEGERKRIYLSPSSDVDESTQNLPYGWKPDLQMPPKALGFAAQLYFDNPTYGDLFTARQLILMTTFADLVSEARELALNNAESVNHVEPGAYADAIATYLGLGVSRLSDIQNSLCGWENTKTQVRHLFTRQAIPMMWDYGENNAFGGAAGDFATSIDNLARAVERQGLEGVGFAVSADAATQSISLGKLVSTDPPYYDNIGYADLSDFFYVWLRRSLREIYPDLFATMAVPKSQELVATPHRHGGRAAAEAFFLDGMTDAMGRLSSLAHPAFPVTIYYAFKQAETTDTGGHASTGWETFLEAVIRSGFALTGTWPLRSELANRMRGQGANALASSIVLVCRHRDRDALAATRREFLTALQKELPKAIADLQRGNVAPVDMQQAAIGPGMGIFTRYAQVVDSNGLPLSVRDALTMINQALDEVLAHQEGDFDADTRWALTWFEQFGFSQGEYGVAELLANARNTSVRGVVEAGLAIAGQGHVRLLRPEELPVNWTPQDDKRLTVWDMVHNLIRILDTGESEAADLLAQLGPKAEIARELAYRLYSICDRTKRSQDAQRYNALVQSWPEIMQLAQHRPKKETIQEGLFAE